MPVENLGVLRKIRRSRAARVALAVAVAGSVAATYAEPAYAADNIPWDGALCEAMENIQFYNLQYQESYVVPKDGLIRVDDFMGAQEVWAQGHGEGHQSRYFYWRHTNGQYRLEHCR